MDTKNFTKIPKILHLINFRTAPQSHSDYPMHCSTSIEKYFIGWEKRYWDEEDFYDIVSQEEWQLKDAERLVSLGAWAIISDVIRLYALYTVGGDYADWDVEFMQEIPEEFFMHGLILGFEPYTYQGIASAQVGVQCCMSRVNHPWARKLFQRLHANLWLEKFNILPGLCTLMMEEEYQLPRPRSNNTYFYLEDDICIMPHDIFYPFMGDRGFNIEKNRNKEIIYNDIKSYTVALHWEHSQIRDLQGKKQGWTRYLHILRGDDASSHIG